MQSEAFVMSKFALLEQYARVFPEYIDLEAHSAASRVAFELDYMLRETLCQSQKTMPALKASVDLLTTRFASSLKRPETPELDFSLHDV